MQEFFQKENLTENVHLNPLIFMQATHPALSSSITQLPTTPSTVAAQPSAICLYQQGHRGADIEQALSKATQSHTDAKGKASEALATKSMTAGAHIRDASLATRKRGVGTSAPPMAMLNLRAADYRQRAGGPKSPDRHAAQQATQKMLREKAVTQIAKEIKNAGLASDNVGALFLRGNSDGAKMAGEALKGVFKDVAEGIAAKMNQEFTAAVTSLGPNPSDEALGKALTSTYKKLLDCLKEVSFPAQFHQLASDISESLQQAANAQSKKANNATKKQIQTNLDKCKNNIASALLLRSFCVELTGALAKNECQDFKTLMAGRSKFQSGINMHQFAANLLSKINQSTSGTKRSAMLDAFPVFDQFIQSSENNISGFHALNRINKELSSR